VRSRPSGPGVRSPTSVGGSRGSCTTCSPTTCR
jgi:hypothetical protein